jgi:hypothetical protein
MPTIAVATAGEEVGSRQYWTLIQSEGDGEGVRLAAADFRGYRAATADSLELTFLDEAQSGEFYTHDPPLHVDRRARARGERGRGSLPPPPGARPRPHPPPRPPLYLHRPPCRAAAGGA